VIVQERELTRRLVGAQNCYSMYLQSQGNFESTKKPAAKGSSSSSSSLFALNSVSSWAEKAAANDDDLDAYFRAFPDQLEHYEPMSGLIQKRQVVKNCSSGDPGPPKPPSPRVSGTRLYFSPGDFASCPRTNVLSLLYSNGLNYSAGLEPSMARLGRTGGSHGPRRRARAYGFFFRPPPLPGKLMVDHLTRLTSTTCGKSCAATLAEVKPFINRPPRPSLTPSHRTCSDPRHQEWGSPSL
jgi:hypothetical protein